MYFWPTLTASMIIRGMTFLQNLINATLELFKIDDNYNSTVSSLQ